MISLLTSKITGYLIAAVAAVLLAWWAYHHVYNNGYSAAETHYQAQIAQLKQAAADARNDEIERRAAVQDAAKAREAQRIAEMQADNETLEQKIEELQREADQDPDADKPVLGSSSVQRINKIR